jgi:prepilin-type N-terminal cleavage/methylation domain-containing protein
VRVSRKECHGFTLIELIASITIIAILAAISLPRLPVVQPYAERGYADGIAASLRQARAAAIASDCAVQFTINAAGYIALQRGVSATIPNHCATAGAFVTPVLRGNGSALNEPQPAGVALAANRQFVFAADGRVAVGTVTINVGPHVITIGPSGAVNGP